MVRLSYMLLDLSEALDPPVVLYPTALRRLAPTGMVLSVRPLVLDGMQLVYLEGQGVCVGRTLRTNPDQSRMPNPPGRSPIRSVD